MRVIAVVLLILAIAGLSFSVGVGSCQNITSSAGNPYTLTTDLTGAPIGFPFFQFTCIYVNSSNVILDCAGHKITNDGTAGATGIVLIGSITNVTVKNCNISGYSTDLGISSDYSVVQNSSFNNDTSGSCIELGSSNSNISNNSFASCTYGGVGVSGNSNRINNNVGDGIVLTGSSSFNVIYNNFFNNSGYYYEGIYAAHSSNSNIIYNNTVNNNIGIELDDTSTNNTIYNNTADYIGITLTDFCNNNSIYNNTVRFGNGIKISSSNYTIIHDNIISNNTVSGITLYPTSVMNNIYNNTVMDNNFTDISVGTYSPSDCQNTIVNNTGSGAGRSITITNPFH